MTTLVLQPAALREEATPQPMIASPKLYPAVWLLSVLPVAVLVALDAAAGVMRPSTWLVRFTPALLTLGLVAWATLSAGSRGNLRSASCGVMSLRNGRAAHGLTP